MLLDFIESLLQIRPEFFLHLLGQVLHLRISSFHQAVYIDLSRILMLIDEGIKLWLGELRVIAFVVTVATITKEVDEDIAMKLLTISNGHFQTFQHRFCIISVYMKYRSLNSGSQ